MPEPSYLYLIISGKEIILYLIHQFFPKLVHKVPGYDILLVHLPGDECKATPGSPGHAANLILTELETRKNGFVESNLTQRIRSILSTLIISTSEVAKS